MSELSIALNCYVPGTRTRSGPRPKLRHLLEPTLNGLQILLHPRSHPQPPVLLHGQHPDVLPQPSPLHRWVVAAVAYIQLVFAAGRRQLRSHQRTLRLLPTLHVHARCGTSSLTQEKKCSTAYVLLEVLLQIITTNLALIILGYPFIYFGVF